MKNEGARIPRLKAAFSRLRRRLPKPQGNASGPAERDAFPRAPSDLERSPSGIGRILIVGSCMSEVWLSPFRSFGAACDYVQFNNVVMPERPPSPVESYDFQVIQIALRAVIPESLTFRLPFDEPAKHESAFATAAERLEQFLDATLKWNTESHLTTFVANFLTPQQNPMGRLLPRYDLRNMTYFVEQLNLRLAASIARRQNVHLLDLDQIAAGIGRRHVQDDALYTVNHGSLLSDWDHAYDQDRLDEVPPVSMQHPLRGGEFIRAIWRELEAMHRTLRQTDMVKLVAVDLDDTLWRGVIAEQDEIKHATVEGWPLGLIEALCTLKQRGVMLAIVSKNDAQWIERIWDRIMRGRLMLDDFVLRKIDWRPKAENLGDIIAAVNVLPESVVYIDDNPTERAAIQAAFPGVRVLGGRPYALRSILLWSPETQVAAVSAESARRTEMAQGQIARSAAQQRMSRDEFLRSLGLKVRVFTLADMSGPQSARALELVNKTNQFNTTGRRWTDAEWAQARQSGAAIFCFEAEDRFTHYGLVGVAITSAAHVEQFVMSCRVVGFDIELAVLSAVLARISDGAARGCSATLHKTERNHLCWDLFARLGFTQEGERWSAAAPVRIEPAHIHLAFG